MTPGRTSIRRARASRRCRSTRRRPAPVTSTEPVCFPQGSAGISRPSAAHRPERPVEAVGQVAGGDEPGRQPLMQAGPLLPELGARRSVEQIVELTRIAADVVELIVETAAVEAEIDGIGPVAFADGPNMAAGRAGRQKEEIVEG